MESFRRGLIRLMIGSLALSFFAGQVRALEVIKQGGPAVVILLEGLPKEGAPSIKKDCGAKRLPGGDGNWEANADIANAGCSEHTLFLASIRAAPPANLFFELFDEWCRAILTPDSIFYLDPVDRFKMKCRLEGE